MPASLEYLERCSAETGYQIGALEKVTRLGEIAGEVGRHRALRKSLALKGGTAINLCAGPLTRLSVDLDFNFIGCADREGMLRERPGIEVALEDIIRQLGYQVQRSADAVASRKIYATYRSVLGPTDRIEVDVNFLWRTPFAGVRQAELWQPGELERPGITV
ncbi:MAG: nucleotidyl transferase AbiEii/AbiGii toxin family protein, partial [Phycisphaerales bacterium]|nr:nucleotidyl transferase AbiEii/AbiGii toxin family protein [Phycisphaerales bacterium]